VPTSPDLEDLDDVGGVDEGVRGKGVVGPDVDPGVAAWGIYVALTWNRFLGSQREAA
jgi:hypothetical protein